MINIIPLNRKGLFEKELTNKEIKKLKVSNYCYSIDVNLLSKLLIINRPIKSQKLFIRNILDFLNYIDSEYLTEKEGTIHNSIFIKYFTKNHYMEYKKILSDLCIISKIPHENGEWYLKGEYSMRYKVHNNYLEMDELCLVVIDEGRKKYERKIIIDDRLEDLDERFIRTIDKLEIDMVSAVESEMRYCLNNNLPLSYLRSRINRLFYTKQKRFIKKGNKVDRIYHSFTNISAVARKHLNIRFNYIDITNCQPLLLVSYLIKNEYKLDNEYKYDCESGLIYENFYDLIKIEDLEILRKKVKQRIYKDLFFGFNERSIINKRFRELYPLTWNSLKEISLTKISLASRLQNLESELFNNLIPEKSKHFFTLFDAIYFDDLNDVGDLMRNINKFFNELDINVKLEIG